MYILYIYSGSWNAKGQNLKFSRFKINANTQYFNICIYAYTFKPNLACSSYMKGDGG